jgi:hypothetical protein
LGVVYLVSHELSYEALKSSTDDQQLGAGASDTRVLGMNLYAQSNVCIGACKSIPEEV